MSNLPPIQNPYEAPSYIEESSTILPQRASYGGIGRLAYFGWAFLIAVVYQVLEAVIIRAFTPEFARLLLALLFVLYLGAFMVVVAFRHINLGYNPWWCLGIIVPLVNILVGFRCLICPEGYADHKKLDRPANVMLSVFFGLLLLAIVLFVLASFLQA